ncbi:MAG: PTS mannitol transporter subunit IICB, partial [Microbacterium sp.]|nr:PTS mannitol transporter subunit IICB [Microbacterium sp.]
MTTASPAVATSGGKKAQVAVQRFGTFLSGMIMPNIAAFIAWGLITTLFISVGWLHWWTPVAPILGGWGNADQIGWQHAMTALATGPDGKTFPQYVGLVGSMITYLLPLLIANTGGRMVYGERGGVVASIATMGVIVGTTIPMFLGAMIMGPLAALITKYMDRIWDGKIRPGFEMLVNNFSAGILGMILAVVGFFAFGPVFTYVADGLGAAVQWLVNLGLLPLLSIIVEPAKILFLIGSNPGPGVGVLLAFTFFGVGMAKASAP